MGPNSRNTSAEGLVRCGVSELLGMDEPRTRFVGMRSGLHIQIRSGDTRCSGVGRRMPDLDLITANGPFENLHPPAHAR